MEEKMNDRLVPTAVLTMDGSLKDSTEFDIKLSTAEENVLNGRNPVIIGHAESWCHAKVTIIFQT